MKLKSLLKNKLVLIVLAYYLVVLLWWFKIFTSGVQTGTENYLFNQAYVFFHIAGGISGLVIAHKKWGGFNSLVGKGISFLSLGLLAQGFGQTVWTYYNFFQDVEVPYPSLADIGYFGLIPLYIYAMYNFAKSSGINVSLKTLSGKLQAVIIPVIMLVVAYALFLKDLPVDLSQPLKTFFDWATPAFDAISVSIGILTYSLSKSILGGKMKFKILYLVFALVFEYITEYVFLYRAGLDLYYNAGPVDLMFATSAMIMTVGILQFNSIKE